MLYLFLLGIPGTALAALLTFTAAPLYPFYSGASRLFGLSVLDDQHLGGLLMWIPMHMILFLAFCIVFFKWFDQENSSAGTVYQKSLS
jgi:cytochrome c oxidase assembly factor CtaG